MTEGTLVEIIKDDSLLLIRNIRGISKGKWNGPGGKMHDGETPERCATREVLEETGLKVSNLFYHGLIDFYDFGGKEMFAVHLFSTKEFSGEPKTQKGEGEIRWFPLKNLPMQDMWKDDEYWLPHMLNGERFDAEFHFNDDESEIVKHEIRTR